MSRGLVFTNGGWSVTRAGTNRRVNAVSGSLNVRAPLSQASMNRLLSHPWPAPPGFAEARIISTSASCFARQREIK